MFETGITAAVVAVSAVVAGPAAIALVSDEARELASLLNQTRAAVGLPALTFSASLSDVAQRYAEQMATGEVPFEHNLDLWKQLPTGWTLAGENIAYRSSGTMNDFHMQWVNCPGHYANMLRGFDNVGIGHAISNTGTIYAVQVFGLYLRPLDPLPEEPGPAETSALEPTAPTPTTVPTPGSTSTPVPTPRPVSTPTVAPEPESQGVPAPEIIIPVSPTVPPPMTTISPGPDSSQASQPLSSPFETPGPASVVSDSEITSAAAAPPSEDGAQTELEAVPEGVVPAESIAAPAGSEPPPSSPSLAALGVAGSALAVGLGGGIEPDMAIPNSVPAYEAVRTGLVVPRMRTEDAPKR